jgi:hypothetical protein
MNYSLGDVFITMVWFMLLFAWIWLLVMIVSDIFRDHDLSGWGKAAWTFFLIVLPWIGALAYLIARGRSMNERSMRQAARQEEELRQFVRSSAATSSVADELAKLNDLRQRGQLSDGDYEQAKARVLGAPSPAPAPQSTVAPPRQPI